MKIAPSGLARDVVGMRRRRAQEEQRGPVVSAERAGEAWRSAFDDVGDLSTLEDADTACPCVGDPDRALGVEGDPVGARPSFGGQGAGSRACRRRRCRSASAAAIGSPTSKVLLSGVMTEPFGNRSSSATTWAVPSARTSAISAVAGAAPTYVVAGVADIRVADGVDDHVVALARGDRRQVGVQRERAVISRRCTGRHADHHHAAVGQPAEPGRSIVEVAEHHGALAVGGHGVDRPLVEVASTRGGRRASAGPRRSRRRRRGGGVPDPVLARWSCGRRYPCRASTIGSERCNSVMTVASSRGAIRQGTA